MKKIFFLSLLLVSITAGAQITKASLQASGLTCSMCSRAVKDALEKLPVVEKVMVDIKNQQYNISFKAGVAVEVDELKKAVEDAGFSVAKLQVTAQLAETKLQKDAHVSIGGASFHFLNADNRVVNGETSFTVVDKSFVTAKEFKKYSGMTKMRCVQTGRMESCCTAGEEATVDKRVYHVII